MSRKRIAGAMLVGVLVLVGVTGGSSSAQDPYGQNPNGPKIVLKVSLVRVKLSGVAVIGTQTCGSSPCTTSIKGFAAIRRKAGYKVKLIAPPLAAGATGKIKAKFPKKTLRRFRHTKTGHGHIKTNATITSATGSDTAKGTVRFQAKKFTGK